jgi:signal peptidase I
MDLRVGEIAVYQASAGTNSTITHRVVERVLDGTGGVGYRFQGDANLIPDRDVITPSRVVGKVEYVVPWLGYAAAFANTLGGKITLAGAGLTAIAIALTRSALKRRGEGVELAG